MSAFDLRAKRAFPLAACICMALVLHAAALLGLPYVFGPPALSARQTNVQPVMVATVMEQTRVATVVEEPSPASTTERSHSSQYGALASAAQADAPVRPPVAVTAPLHNAAPAPLSLDDAAPGRAGGFDVGPVPSQGWKLGHDADWLESLDGQFWYAVLDIVVSAQGRITEWKLVDTNVERERMLSVLRGIELTEMTPAVAGMAAVDARVRVEIGQSPEPF